MRHLKIWENFNQNTDIKSRKKNGFLYIVIDDIEYIAWMWNPTAIEKEFRDNLIDENSWLIEVENNKTGSSKPFRCENCLDISPYSKGDSYLDSKKVRSLLIDKTKEYHELTHK